MSQVSQLGTVPDAADAIRLALILRAAWLLPDWLAKWRRLVDRRDDDQAGPGPSHRGG